MQVFPIEIDNSPLNEGITISSGIAHFDTNPPTAESQADVVFLRGLPRTRCWYGACDCDLHPIIVSTERKFTELPLASEVLKALRARDFKSSHIANLDAQSIPYPGYHPDTDNDEIHTDSEEQSIFCRMEDLQHREGEIDPEYSPDDSFYWHQELRKYVWDGHLYYVLLHEEPENHGEFAFSEWVILFAVGVSKKTGNLVGAVTHQACHNFCD
ncbi:MAG: hypothetical protein GX577_12220 [Leptolinea sp.]|nr:hypothetical protein [Leptolinea sp.]